jgi:hypothetical protein
MWAVKVIHRDKSVEWMRADLIGWWVTRKKSERAVFPRQWAALKAASAWRVETDDVRIVRVRSDLESP